MLSVVSFVQEETSWEAICFALDVVRRTFSSSSSSSTTCSSYSCTARGGFGPGGFGLGC